MQTGPTSSDAEAVGFETRTLIICMGDCSAELHQKTNRR
jgi:hypothetical protein